MIIYLIKNKINGKLYVGQTIHSLERRFREHLNDKKGYCRLFSRALKKYGKENFELSVLEKCENIDEMNIKESNYIKNLNSLAPNGYNLTTGGGNRILSDETRNKLVEKRKGKKPNLGKKHTQQAKDAMSAARKGKQKGKDNPMFGRSPSALNRAAVSLAHKGKNVSLETRMKLSKAAVGKIFSQEHRDNMSKSRKKTRVLCLNNNMIYESISVAARELGLGSGNIAKVVSGMGKSVKGFQFSKIDEVENASN